MSRKLTIKTVFFTTAGLAVAGGIGAAAVLASGMVSFAADGRHSGVAYDIIHNAFKRSVSQQARTIEPPEDLNTEGRIALGAQHYAQNCVRCHGAPGLAQNPQVLAMHPRPQFMPAVVDQFTASELHWIVDHGVMMSAMPAWPANARRDEPWHVVAFLNAMRDMDAEEYRALVSWDTEAEPKIPFGDPVEPMPAQIDSAAPPLEEYAYAAPSSNWADLAFSGMPITQCIACHGADGDGAPTMGEAPNLTIQTEDYLRRTLTAYATGERKSGFMQVVAAELSPSQIDALAAHYASLDPVRASEEMPDASLVSAGESIAIAGLPERGIPACGSCHEGASDDAGAFTIPTLAGQSEIYMNRQLRQFREGGRGGIARWNPMTLVAQDLEDEDIDAVSAYFASLEPGTQVDPEVDTAVANIEHTVTGLCVECHEQGLTGAAGGEFPNLTLQTRDYTLTQLHAFRGGDRQSTQMSETVGRLSLEELTQLANYVGAMDPVPSDDAHFEGDVALGQRIAEQGLPEREVSACLSCHGQTPTTDLTALPRLHGQYAGYIESRLTAYADQTERSATVPEWNPMPEYASELTGEERRAVAAWFASQAPLPK